MPDLELADARLHYERHGTGRPTFVLVHGGFCTSADWHRQAEALGRTHGVVTLDLRGHGRSSGAAETCSIARWAADVAALIETLGVAPVVLVGHSLASRIVVEAAAQHPHAVAGIVLVDGSRSYGVEPPADFAAPAAQTLAEILDTTIGPYADEATRATIVATMSSAPPPLMTATVGAMRDWDVNRAAAAFAALPAELPMLAIQSSYHDQYTLRRSLTHETRTTPYLDFVRSLHPRLQVHILPDTGHFSMLERADEVTALIETFDLTVSD